MYLFAVWFIEYELSFRPRIYLDHLLSNTVRKSKGIKKNWASPVLINHMDCPTKMNEIVSGICLNWIISKAQVRRFLRIKCTQHCLGFLNSFSNSVLQYKFGLILFIEIIDESYLYLWTFQIRKVKKNDLNFNSWHLILHWLLTQSAAANSLSR